MKILHITDKNTWTSAQKEGIYQADTLDNEGFIHCCLPAQLEGVLEQWFSGVEDLVILEIDPDKINTDVVYENLEGGKEKFPHIYGPIPLVAISKSIL